jgi:HEXXH motif-containing protein
MAFPSIDGLTQPVRDTSVLRSVLNQHWRVLVQDFLSLSEAGVAPGIRALHQRVFGIVQGILKWDPRVAVRLLRRPVIAGLVGTLRRRSARPGDATSLDDLVLELDLLLLTELAASRQLMEEVQVEPLASWPVLRSLSARVARQPPAGSRLSFAAGTILARDAGDAVHVLPAEPGPPGYLEVAGGILFGLSDNNPLLSVQGHPDRAGNQVDLGGHPVEEWLGMLRQAFELIEQYQPLIFEEMRLSLELLVPVGYHDERHFSVSYEEAVGAIYLTLHPGVMTMAEALMHEFQHNKLNAVFRWDPILQNAHTPLFASPVRPDPRPLHGVLLAVHAFQPVAALYEAMTKAEHPLTRGRDWKKRFRQIIDINRAGAETVLRHGKPTPVGAGLLREMRALDVYYAKYAAEHLAGEVGSAPTNVEL